MPSLEFPQDFRKYFLGFLTFTIGILFSYRLLLNSQDEEIITDEGKNLTLQQLRKNNGSNGNPIFLCLRGDIYDVSSASNFYGPGNGYHIYAGRDVTRAFAKASLSESEISNPNLSDLDSEELGMLEDWVHKFQVERKYPIVGKLIPKK